jgi:16S rRNA U1498 N3-methylase RsmE
MSICCWRFYRRRVMRRLWAKIAAMGVGQIILTNAGRVERNYFDTHVLTPDAAGRCSSRACSSARRACRASIHRQFKVLVEDELDQLFPAGLRRRCHCRARRVSVTRHSVTRASIQSASAEAVGPKAAGMRSRRCC